MIDFKTVRLRRVDSLNWSIDYKTKKGNWNTKAYFPKLDQAADYLLQTSIEDKESLRGLTQEVKATRDQVLLEVTRMLGDLTKELKGTLVSVSTEDPTEGQV